MKTLLKNLVLVDSKSPLNLQVVDVLIDGELIATISESIENSKADTIIEFNQEYISSGWIDMHVHCFKEHTDISVEADRIGIESGVPCVIDAGSSGELNFLEFYNQNKDKKTIVKAWLNIASTGLKDRNELRDPNNVNVDKTIKRINEYPDFIVGLKLRASKSVMGDDTETPFLISKIIKKETKKPMMVHFGNNPPTITEVLNQMDADDVLTHCFHGKPNNILSSDLSTLKPIVMSKRNEGIKYDIGHGQESFSYKIASLAKNLNFYPDSISSDLHKYNLETPVKSLANVVNKFLNLGFDLNEVINWVTYAPAEMTNLDDFKNIDPGSKAHFSIFRITDQPSQLIDSTGEIINTSMTVKMKGSCVNGEYIEAKYEN